MAMAARAERISLDAIDLSAVRLHLPTALFAAELAADAYHPYDRQVARAPVGLTSYNLDAGRGIEGAVFVGEHAGRPLMLIVVRGSEFSASDWLRNFAARTVAVDWRQRRGGRPVRMHRGYYRAVKTLRGTVGRASATIDMRRAVVLLTGHSAGGGICEGLADYFISMTPVSESNVRLYTFGAPPVWASGHGRVMRRYRVLYDDDPVPAARLPWPLPGAYHVTVPSQHALATYVAGAYLLESSTGALRGMSSAQASAIHAGRITFLPWRWIGRLKSKAVSHRMSGYRNALRKLCEQGARVY